MHKTDEKWLSGLVSVGNKFDLIVEKVKDGRFQCFAMINKKKTLISKVRDRTDKFYTHSAVMKLAEKLEVQIIQIVW